MNTRAHTGASRLSGEVISSSVVSTLFWRK
jgi:hypothetical protein